MSGTGFPSGSGLDDPAAWAVPVQPGVPDTPWQNAEHGFDVAGYSPPIHGGFFLGHEYGETHTEVIGAPSALSASCPASPTDTQMLDWLIKHKLAVHSGGPSGYFVVVYTQFDGDTPRAAIAAAMKEHP
jgi:hypothetical protein